MASLGLGGCQCPQKTTRATPVRVLWDALSTVDERRPLKKVAHEDVDNVFSVGGHEHVDSMPWHRRKHTLFQGELREVSSQLRRHNLSAAQEGASGEDVCTPRPLTHRRINWKPNRKTNRKTTGANGKAKFSKTSTST